MTKIKALKAKKFSLISFFKLFFDNEFLISQLRKLIKKTGVKV